MTVEWSSFWTTSGIGDGFANGYTQAQVADLWHAVLAHGSPNVGVVPDYGSSLAVTYAAGKYTVAPGAAAVRGFLYMASGAVEIAAEAPVGATRIDRIVLEADWATQTVRAVRITAGEGLGVIGLTQTTGDVWQIPLAQASWPVGGDPTLTDQREFVGGSEGTPETSDATPLTLALRDASGRTKMVAPSAASDVAIKQTVDDHAALTGSNAHGATAAATADKIITRDANGRAKVAAPAEADDIARLDTVQEAVGVVPSAKTARSTASLSPLTSWTTLVTIGSIVTTGTSLLLIEGHMYSVAFDGVGVFRGLRAVIDGSIVLESNGTASNGGESSHTNGHWAQSVAAGTHSVALQGYATNQGATASDCRLTVLAIKTGA